MSEQQTSAAATNTDATSALASLRPSFIETGSLLSTSYDRSQTATVHLDDATDLDKVNAAVKEIKAGLGEERLSVKPELYNGTNGDQDPTLVIRVTRRDFYVDQSFADTLAKLVNPKYKARATGSAEIVFEDNKATNVVIRMVVTKGATDADRNKVNTVDGVHKSRVTKDYEGRTVIKFTITRAQVTAALRDDTVQELVDTVAGNVAEKLGLHVTKPITVSGIDNDELLYADDDEG